MKSFSTAITCEIRRDNGSRVKINMELKKNHNDFGHSYSFCVTTCEKGRRTWLPVYDDDCYKFRDLPFGGQERADFIYKKQLEVVTPLELADTAMKLWEQMKP